MLKYYYLLFTILILGGCSLTDSDKPIPSYLVINEVNVFTTESQGAPTHKLSDVWITADNELIGVFEIPIKIPIIVTGETTEFKISPGFRNNGETSRSFIYNLMTPQVMTIPLAPGEEVEISPTFTYAENAIFDFVEGFESSGHIFSLDLDSIPETFIDITDEDAIEGSKSGKISLDEINNDITVATVFKYERSQSVGSESYFEMDYRCDIPFFVGVIYVQDDKVVTQPLIALNTKAEWNKIYIDFTSILTSPQIESYRVYLTTNVEQLDQTSGEIFLDNLKFVHF